MQKQVEKKKYYVVRERAVPEVLLKVVEAKRLLESNRVATVQEAAEKTGISRSSFYKYKDDIFPFHEETKGKTITFIIQMDDEPGLLSMVLQTIARFHGNILTIHQSIPINGVATLTLSVDILPGEGDAEAARRVRLEYWRKIVFNPEHSLVALGHHSLGNVRYGAAERGFREAVGHRLLCRLHRSASAESVDLIVGHAVAQQNKVFHKVIPS